MKGCTAFAAPQVLTCKALNLLMFGKLPQQKFTIMRDCGENNYKINAHLQMDS
ncbi:hypothetical protein SuNHUV7_38090 (plasmid) [Pseudoseohaeicola sp. NH-UV-7]|uniref:hypothetical protein n=1 Tax=Sulfitobacter sp. JL08 TaxID=2070369 RepID=UPI00196628E9|nr:hypothetical protein [Sulfitobacter sp. JL08]